MERTVFDQTKENITKAMGASSYDEVVFASEDKIESLIKAARKKAKIKMKSRVSIYSYGNPYVMLSRKINNKGKRVR